MCRKLSNSQRSRRILTSSLIGLWLWVITIPAAAQITNDPGGITLTGPTKTSLLRLQEHWTEWSNAYLQGRTETAEASLKDIEEILEILQFERLPDLSLGALGMAHEAYEKGELERALQGIAAAERLDPDRPETSFLEGDIARREGNYLGFIQSLAQGYWRSFNRPETSRWLKWTLVLWIFLTLLVSGLIFITVQFMTKGGALLQDLSRALDFWPGPLRALVIGVLLLWPLVLPGGWVWILVYWSILLWGYGSVSERVILVMIWFALGASPTILEAHRNRLNHGFKPQVAALEALQSRSLYGRLFSDLGVMTVEPEQTDKMHFLADLHRHLGQWEIARRYYLDIIEADPRNAAARNDLGLFFFRRGDYGQAVARFQEAIAVEPNEVIPHYNLAQAYSEMYKFDNHREELAKARAIDKEKVSEWIAEKSRQRVIAFERGINNIDNLLEEEMGLARNIERESSNWVRGRVLLPLGLAGGVFLIALALWWARRRSNTTEADLFLTSHVGPVYRVLRVMIPGISSAEEGYGVASFLGILAPVSCLTLVVIPRLGYMIPLPFTHPFALTTTFGAIGFLVIVLLRWQWDVRVSA